MASYAESLAGDSAEKEILSAKKEETRNQRIAETVSLAAKNIRANQWKPK